MPKIKLTTTDGTKLELELAEGTMTFGRAEGNDLVIPDTSVSSRHGEFHVKGESLDLVDLGSTNGTHVNGKRIERETIQPGGKFRLGSVDCELIWEAPPVVEEEAPAVEAESAAPDEPAVVAEQHAVVISGLGATPCPVKERKGFGPKIKEKDKTASLIITAGVVSLIVCAVAALLILRMGA